MTYGSDTRFGFEDGPDTMQLPQSGNWGRPDYQSENQVLEPGSRRGMVLGGCSEAGAFCS